MSLVSSAPLTSGLSDKTLEVIMASWRPATCKQYSVYLNRWKEFCGKHHIDIFSPTVQQVLTFLTDLFEANASYSSVNTARSALSTIVTLPGNISVGNHPLISRFVKGVFQIRPALPRYTQIWDTDIVLNYLRTVSPVINLSLKDLTYKVTMLLMLLSGQRIQTIQLLNVEFMEITNSRVKFLIHDKVKQTRPGKHLQDIVIKAYAPDRRLCIVNYLNAYLKATETIRGDEKQLLITYSKPHKKASKDTISRWLKDTLIAAGVDTTVYSAYSVRSASTSAAKAKGVPIDQILTAGGWSSMSTFAKYYNKPIKQLNDDYSTSLLKPL